MTAMTAPSSRAGISRPPRRAASPRRRCEALTSPTLTLPPTGGPERKAPVSVHHLQVALERVHDTVLVSHQAEALLAPMAPTNRKQQQHSSRTRQKRVALKSKRTLPQTNKQSPPTPPGSAELETHPDLPQAGLPARIQEEVPKVLGDHVGVAPPASIPLPDDRMAILDAGYAAAGELPEKLAVLREKLDLLGETIEPLLRTLSKAVPEALAYRALVNKDGLETIDAAASTFGESGERLRKWMRYDEIADSPGVTPYQTYMDNETLVLKVCLPFEHHNGKLLNGKGFREEMFVTPKGLPFLAARYGENGTHTRLGVI